jgi:aconitate hydratase 2/2-methylisocitrate dehydratase
VAGETNTDDLSPAPDAWSRPDIPLHALAMLKNKRDGITPEEDGKRGPVKFIEDLRAKGNLVAYVGDVVGTGSSRKSATNSVLWFTGEDIPLCAQQALWRRVPGQQDRPDLLQHHGRRGRAAHRAGREPDEHGRRGRAAPLRRQGAEGRQGHRRVQVKSEVLFDEVRAGGRIPLIIGRGLTAKAREALGLPPSTLFRLPQVPRRHRQGFHAGAKDGRPRLRPARRPGRAPGTYCEPKMTSVGSQDTTGPMTRDELKDLACLGFRPTW